MSSMNFTCDVCGREVFSCTFVNGMKFCAKCYQETFGETDKDRKIADLETKLAECEKKAYSRGHSQRDIANEIKLNALREDVANKEKRIVELKQQLAECEKSKESYRLQNEHHHLQLLQFYSRLGVEAFGADIHEKALETLMIMKEQLAEKTLTIEQINKAFIENRSLWKGKYERANQDKISFTIEQLEKVKETAECVLDNALKNSSLNQSYYDRLLDEIDNQIKQLKEMK